MSDKQFISNLSSTYADVRRLDAKKINLKGKNILEYIDENKTVILDERGTNADDELDIWNSYITKDEKGNVIVDMTPTPKEHTLGSITNNQKSTLYRAAKIINNEVLDTDNNHLMYWQTDGLTDTSDFTVDLSRPLLGSGEYLTTFTSDLSSLTNGYGMFYGCYNLTTFISDLSSLTSSGDMFSGCSNLTTFTSDLSSLTFGEGMFIDCSNLTTFTSDLSSLTSGSGMFINCSNLTTFTSDLSSLTSGEGMFNSCSNLTTFASDLSSLTDGKYMFRNCSNLTTFTSDLSSLTSAYGMFNNCSKLTTFASNLSSLTNGQWMFDKCKLDAQSVSTIITFLPTNTSRKTINIGIGIVNIEDAKQAFAEECYCDSWEDLNQEFSDKNWNVEWQFNGEASTFDLRSPRPSTAVYAKLEEVIMPTDEKERKPSYKYTSVDGTKLYNIHWYHESNMEDESYTLFDSLEAAIESYNVILKS